MYYFIDLTVVYKYLKEMELYGDVLGLERYLNATKNDKDIYLIETIKSIFKKFWMLGYSNYFVRDGMYFINMPKEKLTIRTVITLEFINGTIYVSVDDAKTSDLIKNYEENDENDEEQKEVDLVNPEERNSTSEEKQLIAKHIQTIVKKIESKLSIDVFAKAFYGVLNKNGLTKVHTKMIPIAYMIYDKVLKHFPSFTKLSKREQLTILKDAFPPEEASSEPYMMSRGVVYELDKRGLLDRIVFYDPALRKTFEYTLEFERRRSNNNPELAETYGADDLLWSSYGYSLEGKHMKRTFTLSAIRNILNNYDGYKNADYGDYKEA